MAKKSSIDSEKLADQLHTVAIHLLRRLRREDDSSGLNAPRLSALSVIVFGGPITLGDLAAAEQVRPPTMTRLVNALEELGLVTKQKTSQDGRNVVLLATSAGRELLIAGRKRRVRALASQVEVLSSRQKETLQSAAQVLQDVIRSMQTNAE
jgi:DNA-binding MarR family transcriptional regulator